MQAVILVGGKGQRLRPYTYILPKPLMPVGDTPILEIMLSQLKYYGFNDIIMALGYRAKLIKTFFGDGKEFGLNIRYSYETNNLGTAAPLALIKDLDDYFLVMNGDILTNFNYRLFFETHKKNTSSVTIASYLKDVKINLGVMKTNDMKVIDYIEKPTLHYEVSMGIYAFKRDTINYIPYNEHFDFPDLIKKLLEINKHVNTYHQKDCIWLDIGRKEDYERSLDVFKKQKEKFLPE
jgi:NDP-sugar pyrophosphorylase family protein